MSTAPAAMSFWKDSNVARFYKGGERLTGPPAKRLIQQVGLLQAESDTLVVLDSACGTGVVSSQLYEMLDESDKERLQLTCGDFSEGMVQSVQQRIIDNGWKGAKAQVVDAQKTGLPDGSFTHVLINFGVMLMPDPTAALNECFRILKPGGVCGISTWDTLGWTPHVRGAIATITGAPPFPDDETFLRSMSDGKPWHRAEYVEQKLGDHGFQGIKVEIMVNSYTMDSATYFVELFSGMSAQFTAKFWSEDDHARYGREVKPALMKYMTEQYPDDQAFELTMVAIIASARKP